MRFNFGQIFWMFLFFACSKPVENNLPFPDLEFYPMTKGEMEKETGSTIEKMFSTDIHLKLAWKPIHLNEFSFFRIRQTIGTDITLAVDSIPINKTSVSIRRIPYDTDIEFSLHVVNKAGEESGEHKSIVPMKFHPTDGQAVTSSNEISALTEPIFFTYQSSNRKPEINVDSPNLFDSISVNISYFDEILDRPVKVYSGITDYETLLFPRESDGYVSRAVRRYTTRLDSVKNLISSQKIKALQLDPENVYFTNSDLSHLFIKKGHYFIHFYFYKKNFFVPQGYVFYKTHDITFIVN